MRSPPEHTVRIIYTNTLHLYVCQKLYLAFILSFTFRPSVRVKHMSLRESEAAKSSDAARANVNIVFSKSVRTRNRHSQEGVTDTQTEREGVGPRGAHYHYYRTTQSSPSEPLLTEILRARSH